MQGDRRARLHVCVTCRAKDDVAGSADTAGRRLWQRLQALSEASALPLVLEPVECLAVCTRAATVAFAGEGRWSYLFGDLDPAEPLDDLLAYATAYAEATNGIVPIRQRPAAIRRRTIARVPPIPSPLPEAAE